ncbi:hypothetical protein ACRJ4W_28215 [Streptomyces sp. GLT-R25]
MPGWPAAPRTLTRAGSGQVGHAVGEGLQGEGGGQRGSPFAGQQCGPASGGQGTELGQRRPDEHSGDEVRNGAGEQQRHGPGVCGQSVRKYSRLPEPVRETPELGPGDRVRDSEPAGDETRGGIRPGAGVHQPDDADPRHGDAQPPDSGRKEEGRGTRSAQQSAVVRRSRRHDASLSPPGGTRHTSVVGVRMCRPVAAPEAVQW